MWVIPVGVVGIIVYSEMCGRVAAVSGKAVFDAIRERVGFKAGLGALVSSEIVNLMTLAAEVGGVAIALQLLSGLPYRWLIVLARRRPRRRDLGHVVRLDRADLRLRRSLHARVRGRGGEARPRLGQRSATGFVPHVAASTTRLALRYFAVGLLGAAMTPYEVYFYSSGGVEERWTPKDSA